MKECTQMELTDLADLIKSRRSIRRWQDKEVSEELLMQAIDIATWAPNAGNQQNWRFYVILNRDTIIRIADAVQFRADLMRSWPEAQKFGGEVARWRERASFFRTAPAVIAVCIGQYQSLADKLLAAREQSDTQASEMRAWRKLTSSSIQTAASATAYLLLVLHQMGLGAVWMTGPMQAKGDIEKILRLPRGVDLVAFIPVGYPAGTTSPQHRRPVTEVYEIIR